MEFEGRRRTFDESDGVWTLLPPGILVTMTFVSGLGNESAQVSSSTIGPLPARLYEICVEAPLNQKPGFEGAKRRIYVARDGRCWHRDTRGTRHAGYGGGPINAVSREFLRRICPRRLLGQEACRNYRHLGKFLNSTFAQAGTSNLHEGRIE
jgi:hypothetical protein